MTLETRATRPNRMRNRANGSGSLLPTRSICARNRSVRVVVADVLNGAPSLVLPGHRPARPSAWRRVCPTHVPTDPACPGRVSDRNRAGRAGVPPPVPAMAPPYDGAMSRPTPPSSAYLDHLADETAARTRVMAGRDDGRGASGGTAESSGVRDDEPAGASAADRAGAPPALATAVEQAVEQLRPELGKVVETLHAHPETAFAEHQSARLLVDLVRRYGIPAQLGVHGVETAFRAELGTARSSGEGGPTIAICAEYDALPDIGHACGHNVIADAGVGAFLALREVMSGHDAPAGRVVLLGTPAEEGHSGKEVLARHGAFDDVDAAVMVHPYPHDVAEQVWLGRRLLTWTFTGRAAHASAQPFMGRNALDAANLAYQGIGLLRQQMPPAYRIHATVVEGGTSPNVIPERAVMRLYARSKYPDTLKDLSRRLDDVARGAALMTGTEVEIAWDDGALPSLPVRTNQALTRRWVA